MISIRPPYWNVFAANLLHWLVKTSQVNHFLWRAIIVLSFSISGAVCEDLSDVTSFHGLRYDAHTDPVSRFQLKHSWFSPPKSTWAATTSWDLTPKRIDAGCAEVTAAPARPPRGSSTSLYPEEVRKTKQNPSAVFFFFLWGDERLRWLSITSPLMCFTAAFRPLWFTWCEAERVFWFDDHMWQTSSHRRWPWRKQNNSLSFLAKVAFCPKSSRSLRPGR